MAAWASRVPMYWMNTRATLDPNPRRFGPRQSIAQTSGIRKSRPTGPSTLIPPSRRDQRILGESLFRTDWPLGRTPTPAVIPDGASNIRGGTVGRRSSPLGMPGLRVENGNRSSQNAFLVERKARRGTRGCLRFAISGSACYSHCYDATRNHTHTPTSLGTRCCFSFAHSGTLPADSQLALGLLSSISPFCICEAFVPPRKVNKSRRARVHTSKKKEKIQTELDLQSRGA